MTRLIKENDLMISNSLSNAYYAANPGTITYNYKETEDGITFLRWQSYNNHKDRKVGGAIVREEVYFHRRDLYLEGYITTSLVSFALSWYVYKKEGRLGSYFNTERNGMKTAFYAFPVNDGARFGTITTF